MRMAAAIPMPNILKVIRDSVAKIENTAIMIAAALYDYAWTATDTRGDRLGGVPAPGPQFPYPAQDEHGAVVHVSPKSSTNMNSGSHVMIPLKDVEPSRLCR